MVRRRNDQLVLRRLLDPLRAGIDRGDALVEPEVDAAAESDPDHQQRGQDPAEHLRRAPQPTGTRRLGLDVDGRRREGVGRQRRLAGSIPVGGGRAAVSPFQRRAHERARWYGAPRGGRQPGQDTRACLRRPLVGAAVRRRRPSRPRAGSRRGGCAARPASDRHPTRRTRSARARHAPSSSWLCARPESTSRASTASSTRASARSCSTLKNPGPVANSSTWFSPTWTRVEPALSIATSGA